jgi:hypothetical protein
MLVSVGDIYLSKYWFPADFPPHGATRGSPLGSQTILFEGGIIGLV